MVQEVRRIMLSNDELTYAFEAYRHKNPGFMPEGKIINCLTGQDNSVKIVLEVPGEMAATEFIFKGLDVLKPVIRFCLDNNIMLPRAGQKSIAIVNGTASLYVALNVDIDVSEYVAHAVISPHLKTLNPADIAR